MKFKTTKICAGEYMVRPVGIGAMPFHRVRVTKVWYPNDGKYWVADPEFDSNTSDPLLTKREAVQAAKYMLETY